MSKYTAEDFKQAQFAFDPSKDDPLDRYWMRRDDDSLSWGNDAGGWCSDGEMAATGRIPVYADPYSPTALRRVWEHGEEPEPGERATEGMVTVIDVDGLALSLRVNGGGEGIGPYHRIVHRPRVQERDPVADLAQAMEDALPEEAGSSVALRRYAELLAGYGVRVVTDDE